MHTRPGPSAIVPQVRPWGHSALVSQRISQVRNVGLPGPQPAMPQYSTQVCPVAHPVSGQGSCSPAAGAGGASLGAAVAVAAGAAAA
ncbi:hypothetical protein, partial [Anaeromyxobacter sp. SG66]|uniref:hypothetical protein n=1 Tax=Anaeromyxobacter sp. SG66 TaxID=2925410 RepID=UPI001F5A32BD